MRENTRGARMVGGKLFGAYTHKSPIAQGIRREERFYEKALQSKYVSFRRVGQNSADNSWIHKGIPAYKLFDKANDAVDADAIAAKVINNELRNMSI